MKRTILFLALVIVISAFSFVYQRIGGRTFIQDYSGTKPGDQMGWVDSLDTFTVSVMNLDTLHNFIVAYTGGAKRIIDFDSLNLSVNETDSVVIQYATRKVTVQTSGSAAIYENLFAGTKPFVTLSSAITTRERDVLMDLRVLRFIGKGTATVFITQE